MRTQLAERHRRGRFGGGFFLPLLFLCALVSILQSASAAAQAVAVEPELYRPPEPPRKEGGTGFFSISAGASFSRLFGRVLGGGALQLEGGAMISSKLGLGAFSRIDAGSMDFGYLPVGTMRVGFLVMGVLAERVTVAGAVSPGVLLAIRNTDGTWMASGLAALDLTLGIDVWSEPRTPGKPTRSLYLPVTAGLYVLSQVHDGLSLVFSGTLGIGYRYR